MISRRYLRPVVALTLIWAASIVLTRAAEVDGRLQGSEEVKRGREIFRVACVQCHGASEITIQRKTMKGWQKTVYSMIGRGAPILAGEIEPLVAFLEASYGPASPPPSLKRLEAFRAQRRSPPEPK